MGQIAEQNRTKLEWCEPWSLEIARERILAFQKEMPPLWRMLIYVIVIPLIGMLVIRWDKKIAKHRCPMDYAFLLHFRKELPFLFLKEKRDVF